MILDFEFEEVMRLSNVKRWGITEMIREQSVAEHSYNVAMITMALCAKLQLREESVLMALSYALCHDLPEVVTGDLPTSIKDVDPHVSDRLEAAATPMYHEYVTALKEEQWLEKRIVKIADYIDAIQFCQKFMIDSRKDKILQEMRNRMDSELIKMEPDDAAAICKLVCDLWLK